MTAPPNPFQFVPAVKTGSKIRLALVGPPGSGKSYTALTLASALGPNPGMVDTERHRGRKYAHLFGFRHLAIERFDPDDLTRITIAAAEQGIDPLIVDTWSPFWSGQDGMRDQVDQANSSFEGWRKMRPVERRMVDALMGYPGHVIANMRVKVEYVVERNTEGKMAPRRVGLKPEQRDGIEYEFDLVADMDEAVMRVTKSMCEDLPAGKVIERPGTELADTILSWLDRDAVGQPLNPLTVREWALEPGRTVEELGAKFRELDAVGQASAVVYGRDGAELMGIGDLLRREGHNIKRAAQQANGRQPAGVAG